MDTGGIEQQVERHEIMSMQLLKVDGEKHRTVAPIFMWLRAMSPHAFLSGVNFRNKFTYSVHISSALIPKGRKPILFADAAGIYINV